MNKRNKGITEVKIAPRILFNLSFGHITPASELVIRENSPFKYYQTSQSHRKKSFYMFFIIFGVR